MIDRVKTLTPRQQARRASILESVRSQLEESGYEGVSMRKVAEQANVSPSTLYDIYGSKESLILYAIENNLRNLAVEEDQYEPGLERFLHRLESISHFYEDTPDTAEAITKLFFQGNADSPANEVFLVNAIEARRTSLNEMLEMKQLKRGFDVEFYSRALISVTWGTALFWMKGFIRSEDFRSELVRSSMSMLLHGMTSKARTRTLEIIDQHTDST